MFSSVKKEVKDQFDLMVKSGGMLFLADVEKDKLWDAYLNNFSDETEKQIHNCNCCRQFIKNYGNIVMILDGELVTIWDFIPSEELYKPSVKALSALVSKAKIRNIFKNDSNSLGTDKNYDMEAQCTWEHFHIMAPNSIVVKKADKDTVLGLFRDNRNVFHRSLEEISVDAVETVLDLINQGSLYRGDENKKLIESFLILKKEYDSLTTDKDLFVWNKSAMLANTPILKIKNTSIGTLLTDLSKDRDLDSAVTAYERMVAPTNYKRPTALISKGMIENAQKTIIELGYESALKRRFATKEDISVNNVLFVDRNTKISTNVFDTLKEEVKVDPKSFSKVEEVSIDNFLVNILPSIDSVEILVENSHLNNLVSVIAPEDKDAKNMFKWRNNFSWAYINSVTDSIKEKVKAAGGNVEGELRVSLSWFNYDDLDLHVIEPGGNRIGFDTFKKPSMAPSSGQLDVDMNAGSGKTREGVENITWTTRSKMVEGTYTVKVHQYAKRENKDLGCEVEVECDGVVHKLATTMAMVGDTTVCQFKFTKAQGITEFNTAKGFTSSGSTISKEKWGVTTNKFQKVSMIMNSPNYWHDSVGNLHTFFIIEGAKNDEPTRGFFNEFLNEELSKDRKVFEVLGSKLTVEPSDSQVTGVGFSSTQRNSLICKVKGSFERVLKINF